MRRTVAAIGALAVMSMTACGDETAEDDGVPTEYGDVAELIEATNAAIAEHETAELTLTGTDNALSSDSMSGQMRYAEDRTEFAMYADGAEGGVVMVDEIVYLNSSEEIVPGKPWIRIDPEAEQQGVAAFLQLMAEQMVKSSDPTGTLGNYQQAAEIVGTGAEDLDGTETVRHDVDVDLTELADVIEDETDAALIQTSIGMGVETVTYSMWIDGRDLPLQFEIESATPDGGMATSTLVYDGWGDPVEVETPPESETADVSEIEMPEIPETPETPETQG